MSIQQLNDQPALMLSALVGEMVAYTWGSGGFYYFITRSHKHGWYSAVHHIWGWTNGGPCLPEVCPNIIDGTYAGGRAYDTYTPPGGA